MSKLPDKNIRTNSVVLFAIDTFVGLLSLFLAFWAAGFLFQGFVNHLGAFLAKGFLFVSVFLLSFWLNGVYNPRWQRALDALVIIAKSVLLGFILLTMGFTFIRRIYVPFNVLFLAVSLFTTLIVVSHYCFRLYYVKKYGRDPEIGETERVAKVYSFHEVLEKKHTPNHHQGMSEESICHRLTSTH